MWCQIREMYLELESNAVDTCLAKWQVGRFTRISKVHTST